MENNNTSKASVFYAVVAIRKPMLRLEGSLV
jgi:hypothetical protein